MDLWLPFQIIPSCNVCSSLQFPGWLVQCIWISATLLNPTLHVGYNNKMTWLYLKCLVAMAIPGYQNGPLGVIAARGG